MEHISTWWTTSTLRCTGSWDNADGYHQSDRDFDLVSGNAYPRGIAWDGAYFYVVDYIDDKVYVYDADGDYVG